jgi:hypothetical protein
VKFKGIDDEVLKLSVQLQGERAARHALAFNTESQLANLSETARYFPSKDVGEQCRIAFNELRSKLEAEIRDECLKELPAKVEELELQMRSIARTIGQVGTGIKDEKVTGGILKLATDLERETRERCDKDAEIMLQNACELAGVRQWAADELALIEKKWEESDRSRSSSANKAGASMDEFHQVGWDVASTVDKLRGDLDEMRTSMATHVNYDYVQCMKVDVARALHMATQSNEEIFEHRLQINRLDSATKTALEEMLKVIRTCQGQQLLETDDHGWTTQSQNVNLASGVGATINRYLDNWIG